MVELPTPPRAVRRWPIALLLVLTGLLASPGGPAAAAGSPTTVQALRFGVHADKTRLVLDLEGEKAHPRLAIGPTAVVLTFDALAWQTDRRGTVAEGGLVASYALSDSASPRHLTLHTNAPVRLEGPFFLPARTGSGHRLFFDLYPAPPTPVPLPAESAADLLRDGTERLKQAPPDYPGARRTFERAAALGSATAAFNLGQLYRLGLGVPAEPTRAASWYAQAAEAGFAPAQVNLAIMLLQGEGIAPDPKRARRLLGRAAAQGEDRARALLDTRDPEEP